MYVIVQKQDNLVVGMTERLIDNENGSFTDLNEDVCYYKGEFVYYPDVEVPGGINKGQYFYTPEEGFKLAFSNYDIMRARVHLINLETQAEEYLKQVTEYHNSFKEEKNTLEKNVDLLKQGKLTTDEKITLLELVVCDLYETVLSLKGGK